MIRVHDTQSFIEQARQIHGNKYDYSKVNYINSHTPVEIICPEHGSFFQTPNSHLTGRGCGICAKNAPITSDIFFERMKRLYGDKYDFSQTKYENLDTPTSVLCKKHGLFQKTPRQLLKGNGCPLCGREGISNARKETTSKFIRKAEKVHNNFYSYKKTKVTNSIIPVEIICPTHGSFYQSTASHLMGHGCPECAKQFGISEKKVLDELNKTYGNVVYQYKPEWLKSKTSYQAIDMFLPQYNVGVEYQGRQHFGPNIRFKGEHGYKILSERDIRKYNKCKEHGVKLFYISFESNIPENYIDTVYSNIQDLINAINDYVNNQTINLNESDIKTIINEVVKSLLSNYLYEN